MAVEPYKPTKRRPRDTIDEIIQEERGSISLNLDPVDEDKEDKPANIYEQNINRIHSATSSGVGQLSIDKITLMESLKKIWKLLIINLSISIAISVIICLILWVFDEFILYECNLNNLNHQSLEWVVYAIQMYNSLIYIIFLFPILYIVTDEFKTIISNIKRISFILSIFILLFILFIIYGFISSTDSDVISIFVWNICCIIIILIYSITIIIYIYGYHSIYMIFPLLISLLFNYIIINIFIFTLYNINHQLSILFSIIYPILLHLMQIITLKIIKYCQLPYKSDEITKKCFCVNKNESNDNNTSNNDIYNRENDISYSSAVSSQYLFFVCSLNSILISTLQQIGYLILIFNDSYNDIILLSILYIIFEIIARNKFWYELYYRIRYKKRYETYMDTLCAVYYGSKFSIQYIPIMIIAFFNIFQYEPMDCYDGTRKGYSINVEFENWWIILIMLIVVIFSDLFSFLIKRFGTKCDLWGVQNQNGEDLTRKYIYPKISLQSLIIILLGCIIVSIHIFFMWSLFY